METTLAKLTLNYIHKYKAVSFNKHICVSVLVIKIATGKSPFFYIPQIHFLEANITSTLFFTASRGIILSEVGCEFLFLGLTVLKE